MKLAYIIQSNYGSGGMERVLTNRVVELIENRELRCKMGAKAHETGLDKFSETIIMKQWLDVFNSLKR